MRVATRGLHANRAFRSRLLTNRFFPDAFRIEALLIAIMMLTLAVFGSHPAGATVQSGFSDTLIASIDSPTDIAFSPGGRLIVSTQGGTLYMMISGSLQPILDLSNKTCSDFERGMLGVVLDPSFSSNHYIYVYYTFAKFGGCSHNNSSAPVNRVSRFVMSGNTVLANSEVVLVDNMPSPNGNHNAGDLLFGKDGYLYISIGDGGCDLDNSSLCGGQNTNARKRNILTGKILRITRDGGIPSTNPFRGSDSGRCNVNGRTTKTHCQETFVWGLRNPFRMALDPNASGTRIYINDVGQNLWEEIDEATAGADYGWNVREGFCVNGSTSSCGAPPSGMTNPVFAYGHNGCNSITGGAFVPNGVWPSSFNNSYLYADYVCGKIFRLKGSTSTEFGSNLGPLTTLQFGPYGSSQALYYASYAGEIRRISTNRSPVAVATADPLYGLADLEVTFDGSASTDPDNDALTYEWDFDDGSPHATTAIAEHTYTENGVYDAQLTVRDSKGGSNTATVKIDVGNTPPVPEIETPTTLDRFSVGETITLHGSANDDQEGALPDGSLRWDVRLHHDTHEHPFFSGTGNDLEFTAPAPEDLLAATNSYLVINLSATDSTGLASTVSHTLLPLTVDVTVDSSPTNLIVTIEGAKHTTPATVTTWANNILDLSAPDQLLGTGEPVVWDAWSVPGDQSFQYLVPGVDANVTANYELVTGPAFAPIADARVKESSPKTNEGKVTGLSTKGGTTSDYESFLRFDVSGLSGTVESATLYLFAYEGTSNGPAVYRTANTWTETGITWSNKPSSSGGKLDDSAGVLDKCWFTLDVTAAVNGNGVYNFLLRSTSTDALSAYSREASSRQPRLVIVTSDGSGDITAPGTPDGLAGDAPDSHSVVLNWNASTDDTGVTGYDIFRDGVLLSSTAATSFTDSSVAKDQTYGYQVRARDAAGNVSAVSNEIEVDVPPQTTTTVVTANADAYVSEAAPGSNFGSKTQLRAEGGNDPDVISYVKFTIPSGLGEVYRATLRVFVPAGSGNGTSNGPEVHLASANWGESTITWSNRPSFNATVLDDVGNVAAGFWVEYDVTGAANGRSFALVSASTDVVVFSSREGASAPQLVLTTIGAGSASAAEVAPEATATPPASPTPTATPSLPIVDSFEGADLSAWTVDVGFGLTNAIAQRGTQSAIVRSEGTTTAIGSPASATRSIGDPVRELYIETAVYVDRIGENDVDLLTLIGTRDQPLIVVGVDSSQTLTLMNARSGRSTEIVELPADEWHTIRVHLLSGGSQSSVEIWLDSALVYREAQRLTNRPIAGVALGDGHTNRTFTVAFDNLTISATCPNVCSTDLVTATPTVAIETPSPTETAEATTEPSPTETATTEPTVEPTNTPEPAPTETPAIEPTPGPPENTPTGEATG